MFNVHVKLPINNNLYFAIQELKAVLHTVPVVVEFVGTEVQAWCYELVIRMVKRK